MDRCDIHDEFSKRMEQEHERINHRLKSLEDSKEVLYDLVSSIKEQSVNVKSMLDELKNHDERLKTLENRDGEKWREVVKVIIGGVVGVVVGLLFKGI